LLIRRTRPFDENSCEMDDRGGFLKSCAETPGVIVRDSKHTVHLAQQQLDLFDGAVRANRGDKYGCVSLCAGPHCRIAWPTTRLAPVMTTFMIFISASQSLAQVAQPTFPA